MTRFVRTTNEPGVGRRRPTPVLERIRAALWARRFEVDGVEYRARRRGSGERSYDVRFPGGQAMRVRSTGQRVYDDLCGRARIALYERAGGWSRPGMRILDLPSGTGGGAAWLSRRVGPSGAVVAIERDSESVRFARRRWGVGNVAFEIGGAEQLEGEPDGSFDGAVVVLPPEPEAAARAVRRVVGEGGSVGVVLEEAERGERFGAVERSESVNAFGRMVTVAVCRNAR